MFNVGAAKVGAISTVYGLAVLLSFDITSPIEHSKYENGYVLNSLTVL